MPPKQSGKPHAEKLIDDLHKAVQAYVEGNGGAVWVIGSIELVPHNPTSFDLVIKCVGHRPTWESPHNTWDA